MVRTPNTHCPEPGFDPWLGNEDSSRFETKIYIFIYIYIYIFFFF